MKQEQNAGSVPHKLRKSAIKRRASWFTNATLKILARWQPTFNRAKTTFKAMPIVRFSVFLT